ncbi:MAG TPA: hypothetical protein VE422_25895 [Terriglobia bacterium]|nr:hypothetical protein [Terriglobia bacterium]
MRKLTLGFVFTLIVGSLFFALSPARAEQLPGAIGDQEFWRMVTELSEPGGTFQQEFMSNEDSAQFVIPTLKETTRRGGVYIGVGPEQNFTYIAAIQPKLAFVVDIRRENMLEHLMYKALFELSQDRADFISRLFSRKRPPGLDADSSVKGLFDAYQAAERDSRLHEENLHAVMDRLVSEHKFQLSEADTGKVTRILNTFYMAGPYTLRGSGDKNQSYAQLMAATDLTGREQSYLASEQNFRTVQELQRQNLIVPLVGDFAGDKAITSVGQYLKELDATVDVFYVSNVERYLFEQGEHGKQFYANLATLPLDQSSTFIRSVTRDISRRLGIPIPDGPQNWRSFLFPMSDSLKAFANGRIQTYRELFEIGR